MNRADVPDPELDVVDTRIDEVVSRLPNRLRDVLLLVDTFGFSYAEVSATLGIPRRVVVSRLHRARTKVRDGLLETGGFSRPLLRQASTEALPSEDPPAEGSLAAVREVIPAQCYRRSTARGLAYASRDLAIYGAVLAALAVTTQWWLALPLIVLAGLVVTALFVLSHDAGHGPLFESQWLNRWGGRLLMLPSLCVYEAWVTGHNRIHHGYTACHDMDFVWDPLTRADYRALSPVARLRHRLEWSALGSGVYYLRAVWWKRIVWFPEPDRWGRARRPDWWLVAGWATLASAGAVALGWSRSGTPAGGLWMWLKLVVGPFLVFTQVIGWTVYVHHIGPGIRWWTEDDWTSWRARMESTTILRLPRGWNLLFHNIFVHVPHHVDARIPWYELPRAARAIEAAFPDTVVDQRFRVGEYLRSARECKLYDFERGAWMTYAEA